MKKQHINWAIALYVIMMGQLKAQTLLTATEAIALALEHNYDIKIENTTLEVAENNANILNSGYLPTVTASSGATFNRDNITAEFNNGETTTLNGAESSRYNAAVNINYTLFDGLGRLYNYKRLKEEYKLTELQARATIENTISQLLTVYYDVARRSENLEALQETLVISKRRLTRASYAFNYGQNTKLDVLNAEVDINNDSINIITAKQNLTNAKRDLNLVIGNTLNPTFKVDTTVIFLLQLNKQDLYTKMLSNNVELLQIEKRIAVNEFIRKSNTSGYLPSIGLTGAYGWNENNNNAASFVAVSTNTGLSAGINLTWNIFDGGSTITQVKNATLNVEVQRLQKEFTQLTIERNFNNAWDDYQNRLQVYYLQEENINTAKNNYTRTEEKFRLGQVNSIAFRQAQLNLLTAELNRNQAKYDAKLAEIVVLQLSGELLNINF